MTDSEQVRCFVILIRNKLCYLLLYVPTLGYKIDENNLRSCAGGRHDMPPPHAS